MQSVLEVREAFVGAVRSNAGVSDKLAMLFGHNQGTAYTICCHHLKVMLGAPLTLQAISISDRYCFIVKSLLDSPL